MGGAGHESKGGHREIVIYETLFIKKGYTLIMSKKFPSLENPESNKLAYTYLLDSSGKAITALSAIVSIAYALGFIITNFHLLTKYGIYDFELLKARYILTGSFFLVLTYVVYVMSIGISGVMDKAEKKIHKILIGLIGTIFFAGFIGTIIKGITSWVIGNYSDIGIVSTFIRIWSLIAIFATIVIINFIKGGGWRKESINIPIPFSIFTSTLLIAGAYSQLVYPVLPIALGGGDPMPVQLLIENEKSILIRTVIPFVDETKTGKVYLIDQSSTSYFILIPFSNGIQGQAVELRKDYVISVIHLTKTNLPFLRINEDLNLITPTPYQTISPLSP